ncbi:DUF397 domain-containing protein [Streptomyces sp. bgisy159]|uniref:DUF397 domain-containing protein n=1 Tax=Streptomyces sp. bgisy159 TaxID=3413795 RepID=UPI003F49F55A
MSEHRQWHRSSYSDDEGGACVEVRIASAAVQIRDSKTPTTPHVRLTAPAWSAFLAALRPGA